MISSADPSGSVITPERFSTVTPGKFPIFCLSPVSWLKREDFPEFGFPTNATFCRLGMVINLQLKWSLLLPDEVIAHTLTH